MRTVPFSTDLSDVATLLRFRLAGVRGTARRRLAWFAWIPTLLAVASASIPAFTPGAAKYDSGNAFELALLLPAVYAGFVLLAIVSAVASGGGRELIPRDQGVTYPITPATDHFGALLMAPLNIAWLIQGCLLLGVTAYVVGPTPELILSQLLVLAWLVFATAFGQLVAWWIETVRRAPHGLLVVRLALLGLATGAGWLVVTERVNVVLDNLPTVRLAIAVIGDADWPTLHRVVGILLVVALTVVTILAGVWPARIASRMTPRDEARMESGAFPSRPRPGSDFVAMLRIDRAGVWRSVPLRRGLLVLAILPGLVSLAGDLRWEMITILPGLVASGGALLFGVNAWCLDGRGALWRDSLPVSPGQVFVVRAVVLLELLLFASAITMVLAAVRAGPPEPHELSALLCTWIVVCVQVVAVSMHWSVRGPYAVDLRSARATPAPPLVMVGYSARLALATTLTGMMFSGLAKVPDWRASVLLAVPFLAWSIARFLRARHGWGVAEVRARVIATVSS